MGVIHQNPLAGRAADEPARMQFDVEVGEDHLPRRHLGDHRIQPCDEQRLVVRALALDLHALVLLDGGRVRRDRRERQRGLFVRARLGAGDAPHAQVGTGLDMLPMRTRRREDIGLHRRVWTGAGAAHVRSPLPARVVTARRRAAMAQGASRPLCERRERRTTPPSRAAHAGNMAVRIALCRAALRGPR
jgi:hypothetical protein